MLNERQTMAWELSRWGTAFSDRYSHGFVMLLETVDKPGPSQTALIVLTFKVFSLEHEGVSL